MLTEPTLLCREGAPSRSCRTASNVEALLQREDLEILAANKTPAGIQGAHVLTLRSDGVVFRAKWRPESSTTSRNSPRNELGAYGLQKLFLDPDQYVVPPTAAHCFPLVTYRQHIDASAKPAPGTQCVYGILSYWLEDVVSITDARKAGWFHGLYNHALDLVRFTRDPVYRNSIARVNVVTHLIRHGDSHTKNFVVARTSEGSPVFYTIDNSIAFSVPPNKRIPADHDWSQIKVPALPRVAIDRLRDALPRLDSLSTISRVQQNGARFSVGLTTAEIEGVRARVNELLARVARGEITLY